MNRTIFLALLFCVASCARQNLNYQSSHPNGSPNQDNYTVQQTAPVQNNGNYNSNINYNSPSYQTFYDELSPYGNWVNYGSYGYAWVPNEGPGFSPYCTNGQWVYTNAGWTWASNYSWGWAPFHYGRWMRDDMYGWLWFPGNEWAPAWVTWGNTGGYYGWAPIGPGVTPYEGYRPPAPYWNYVSTRYVAQPNVANYAINSHSSYQGTSVSNINVNNMTVINNTNTYNQHKYYSGPPVTEVENASGNKITTVVVNESSKPANGTVVNGNQLNLYRPAINSSNTVKATPAKVVPIENLHPATKTPNSSPVNGNGSKPVQPVQNNQPKEPENLQPKRINQEPTREQPRQENFNSPPKQYNPEPAREQPRQENVNTQPKQQVPQQTKPQPKPQPKPAPKPQPKPQQKPADRK